jgi:hypothetical protein
MSKPFYSLEEACEKLGKSPDELKELVRGGSLREFRDAGKVFYKSDDIDKLRGGGGAAPAAGDEISLDSSDDLPSIAGTGGTSIIGLEAVEEEPAKPAPRGAEPAGPIGVLVDDELEIDADPMAKTQITASPSAGDQVSLEGTGSGSGLLDLTREADDTSLGAELLDEIYPGEEEAAAPPPRAARAARAPVQEEAEAVEEEDAEPVAAAPEAAPAMQYVPVPGYDPSEGLFAGLLVGALLIVVVAGSIAAAAVQGFVPDYGIYLGQNFLYLIIAALLVPLLGLLVGWLIGRSGSPRRA